MDLEALRQTVAEGESEGLEFKKTTGDLKAGMRTLCAMLNGSGGRVIFGVTPGGKIAGQDITDPTLQEVAQEIRSTGRCGRPSIAGGWRASRPPRRIRWIGFNCGSMGSCSGPPSCSSAASSLRSDLR